MMSAFTMVSSRILADVTAPVAMVIAPVLSIVASPDSATLVATLDPLPTKISESVRDGVAAAAAASARLR